MQALGAFLGATLCFWDRARTRAASWLGFACLSNGIAASLWLYLEATHQKPFPSFADAFFLDVIPLVLGAVLNFPIERLDRGERVRIALDSLQILVALGTFSWKFVLGPTLFASGTSHVWDRVIAVAYPVGDLLIVLCLATLLFRSSNASATLAAGILGLGLLFLLSADTIFLHQQLTNTYQTGTSLDLSWPAFCLLSGCAARVLNNHKIATDLVLPKSVPLSHLRTFLPYLMVPPVGILLFVTLFETHVTSPMELGVFVGASLLIGLILLRQFLVLRENLALYRQTRADAENLQRLNEDLRAVQAELVHSAKMASLGTLSAGIAHELNQPIAITRGIAQQLMDDPELPAVLQPDLKLIEAQTHRMSQIVLNLRSFCRTKGHPTERASLNTAVRNVLVLIETQLAAQGIRLEKELADDDSLLALLNTNEVEQVLLNLLNNARDALEGHPRPTLLLRTESDVREVRLIVHDNGPGIAESAKEYLFDPFFTTKEVGKGVGLGLSISRNLVEKNHGQLSVENRGGACFTLRFPKSLPQAKAA